jgi:hypothetical protein
MKQNGYAMELKSNVIRAAGTKEETKARDYSAPPLSPTPRPWKNYEKIAFRIAFIFVVLYTVPTDYGWYERLFKLDYAHLNYRHLNSTVAFYNPYFINHYSEGGFFGLYSYVDVLFILTVSLAGGLVWTLLDRKRKEYNALYYWARVFARYRVAYGIIAWGYKKIFVMQMPFPSEGLLNTEFINFFAKRLYWESIGIVPAYEVFLGFAEFIPGVLMLFRKTTALGAVLSMVVMGNVAISNHAYDIGEHVPSFSLALLSFFILWYDLPGIWNLLIREKNTGITHHYPVFSAKWQNYLRLSVKYAGNFIFVFLFGIFEVYAYTHNDFYKIPNTPGLKGTKGYYRVTEFRRNNKLLPYSPEDSIRWHDATFEEFSSLSIRLANRPQQIQMFAAGSYPRLGEEYDNQWKFHIKGDERRYDTKEDVYDPESRDININWEFSGLGSERHWYFYKADTLNHILYLQHKNRNSRNLKQVLHYSRPSAGRIILSGTNEFQDSIYVVLDRVDKQYPLLVGRRKPMSAVP